MACWESTVVAILFICNGTESGEDEDEKTNGFNSRNDFGDLAIAAYQRGGTERELYLLLRVSASNSHNIIALELPILVNLYGRY